MTQPAYQKILQHLDKDEIINKLCIGQSVDDIHEWLTLKYTDKKFVLSKKLLTNFKDDYLDFYNTVKNDIDQSKLALATQQEIELNLKNNSAYKSAINKMANSELDYRTMLNTCAFNIEQRLAQIYDLIQEDPNTVNSKLDSLIIRYVEVFGALLEKIYKFTEGSQASTIVNNISINQGFDPHINIILNTVKEVLSQMDLESFQMFMESYNEKISNLKPAEPNKINLEARAAEVKILHEDINRKLNA